MKAGIIAIWSCFLLSFNIHGMSIDEGIRFVPEEHWCYKSSSIFVKGPAGIGYYCLYPIGCAITIPVVIVGRGFRKPLFSLFECCMVSHLTFAHVGYLTVGLPFYIVEKVFWDGSCYLYSSIFGNDKKLENKNGVMKSKNKPDCHKKKD